jgi:hypothetical protein
LFCSSYDQSVVRRSSFLPPQERILMNMILTKILFVLDIENEYRSSSYCIN